MNPFAGYCCMTAKAVDMFATVGSSQTASELSSEHLKLLLGEKRFYKTQFHLKIDEAIKKDINKAEMKECKKTTGDLQKYAADVR